MDLKLTGKTALVTGAASGIGAATARILAEEGADVIISYGHNLVGAERTAEVVRSLRRQAWLLPMDVADSVSVANAAKQVRALVAGLDIAILCAGVNEVTPFSELSIEEWEKVIDVNLNGTFYVLKMVEPMLKEGGAVVTVASVAASTGAAHHAHYAAAKAGIVNLTKSAARALAPRVRVNCVSPGLAETAMGRRPWRRSSRTTLRPNCWQDASRRRKRSPAASCSWPAPPRASFMAPRSMSTAAVICARLAATR
jgi:3-oxoacyl-[acyl-carrier protein] reductase